MLDFLGVFVQFYLIFNMNKMEESTMKLIDFTNQFEDIVMVDRGSITEETLLSELEDWDSLSKAALLALLEEAFDLKLEDDALKSIQTFGEVVTLVRERLE